MKITVPVDSVYNLNKLIDLAQNKGCEYKKKFYNSWRYLEIKVPDEQLKIFKKELQKLGFSLEGEYDE